MKSEYMGGRLKILRSCPTFDPLRWSDSEPIPSPSHLEIELTAACTQNCVWCIDKEYRERKGSWDEQLLVSRAVESRARAASLRGGGEPTLHPKFGSIAASLREAGIRLGLITNGTGVVDASLFDWISVSMDAINQEELVTYKRYKKPGGFEKIIGNVASMSAKSRVRMTFLVRKDLDLDKARALAASVGATAHFKKMTGPLGLEDLPSHLADDDEDVPGNAGLPCVTNFLVSRWSFTGEVFLCCGLKDKFPAFGDLTKSSFEEVWQSSEHRRQIRQMAQAAETAKHCPECRMTRYNTFFAEAEVQDELFV